MPARLTLHLADRPARVLVVEEGRDYVLGRERGCDLAIDDDRVSRRHARLAWTAAGWTIADLQSKNGTTVDGEPASGPHPVSGASWLSLGGLIVQFEGLTAEAGRAATAERGRRWQTTLERQRELRPGLGLRPLLERLLASVLELAGAERAFVLLAPPDGELEVAAARGVDATALAGPEFAGSVGAVERVLQTGLPVATSDAAAETALRARASVWRGGIRALVCVPLGTPERPLGAVYADSRKPGSAFTELDVEILTALAGHAALAIAAAELDAELRGLAERCAESRQRTTWSGVVAAQRARAGASR
jgi:hypothetical protein